MKEKKKGRWTQSQMNEAYSLVVEYNMDVAVAARQCGVPRRTLGDRVNKRVPLVSSNGRPSELTPEEERQILNWCDRMNDMGFEISRAEITDVVLKYKPSMKGSNGWWTAFRKRHPKLVLRKTQKMDRMRSGALNATVIGIC